MRLNELFMELVNYKIAISMIIWEIDQEDFCLEYRFTCSNEIYAECIILRITNLSEYQNQFNVWEDWRLLVKALILSIRCRV